MPQACLRFVRESNSIFVLTKNACSRNTYKPLPSVIAEGIEPSISCVSCRCLSRWTTRSSNKVVETGVEPAESLGSRPSRFSCLRTQPYKWRVQDSHLAVRAYEACRCALSYIFFWPQVASPGIEPGYRPYEGQLSPN
jgi:hypothetical protein